MDHPSGMVFFVRGAWPGDEGDFVVESRQKKYGSARIVKLTVLSQERQEAPCPHLGWQEGRCGGCSWMIARYESQLQYKQKRIQYLVDRNQLACRETQILSIKASDKELGYRNRAQFKTDGKKLGYVSPESKVLADIQDCVVLTKKNRETLKALRSQLPNALWKPKPPYLWNYIEVDEDVEAQAIALNQRRIFRQANDDQNQYMKMWLQSKIQNESKNIQIIELFAGSGNFTKIFVEQNFKNVYCAELDQRAVGNLKNKNWSGVQGFVMDLMNPASWKKIPQSLKDAELLFLDPPREGFRLLEKYIEHFPQLKKIIYVSCEPYAWAGDIKNLVAKSWKLSEVQPVDQFPHTPHVELLSVLTRTTD